MAGPLLPYAYKAIFPSWGLELAPMMLAENGVRGTEISLAPVGVITVCLMVPTPWLEAKGLSAAVRVVVSAGISITKPPTR